MAAFQYAQTIDLNNPRGQSLVQQINGHVGDALAHTWKVTLVRGSSAEDLTGYTAMALHNRKDGATLEIVASISGNVVTVTFPQASYVYEGQGQAVLLRLTKAATGEETTVAGAQLNVAEGETGTPTDPSTTIPTLSELLAQIDAANDAATAANAAAAYANGIGAGLDERTGALETAVDAAESTITSHTSQLAEIPKQYLWRNTPTSAPIIIRPAPETPIYPIITAESAGTVKLRQTGKNLLNYDAWKEVYIVRGSAVWADNGVALTASGADCMTDYGVSYTDAMRIFMQAGQPITLSWDHSGATGYVVMFDSSDNVLGVAAASTEFLTVTPTSDGYIKIRFGCADSGTTATYKNIQMEYGPHPTAFEPFAWAEYEYTVAAGVNELTAIPALAQIDIYTPRQNVITCDVGALAVGYARQVQDATAVDYQSGYIRFTVPVNQTITDLSNTGDAVVDSESIVDVDCVLKLPASYTPSGKPTRLLMMCHGAGKGVNGEGNWTLMPGYNALVNAFTNAGYAVFDCNGYKNDAYGWNFWGAPRGVEAWRKAYDYVVSHYNVEDSFSIYGFSMGGLTAIELASSSFPGIKCLALGSPVTSLEAMWDTGGAGAMKDAYGFSGSAFEASKVVGCDPIKSILTVDSAPRIMKQLPPIKVWFGSTETQPSPTDAQAVVTALQNSNGIAQFRLVTGTGHEICYGDNASVIKEILYWINRFNCSGN